jgi:hypothetical protein
MKHFFCAALLMAFVSARGQSIIGTWQQVEKQTCFESQLPESETEKELLPQMGGSSQNTVAKLIRFDAKGRGEEGIFTTGKKKGSSLDEFRYEISGDELQLLDKKSGIMTQRFIIDSLTETVLQLHDALKNCEVRSFSRIK